MTEKRRPWFKFYPDSWRADELLRMCGLQARGLWVEMLAIMHKATPYGHLLVNGIQPSLDDLARLAGAPLKDTRAALAELESKAVFSRTDDGTIYSRKMVRDEVASLEGQANVNKRWASREPKPSPNRDPNRGANSTEDRGQIKEPVANATGKKTTMPTGFDLTPERIAYAQQQRIADVEREWSKFIDYCLSNRKLYADWDAAWRNWCRSPYQQPAQNRLGGNGQRASSPGGGSLAGAMRAVLAAGGEPGLRAGRVSGGQAFDGGAAGADPDPFAELDAAFGSPVRHPGSHALPVIDQEPVEG